MSPARQPLMPCFDKTSSINDSSAIAAILKNMATRNNTLAYATVAVGAARGLVDYAMTHGASREELLQRANLTHASLDDQDGRLPFDAYAALMHAAQDLCADPALALHYAAAVHLAEISIVGLIGNASQTMLEAFGQLQRYGRLVVDVDVGAQERFEFARRHDGLWVVDHRPHPNLFPELTEATFARMIHGTKQFGKTPFALEIHVTHPAPAYRAEYARVLGAPTKFNAAWNAMRIDETWLTNRITSQQKYVFGVLSKHAEELLSELDAEKTARGEVERLLMTVLHKGEVTIEAIAAMLGTSRQTLYRRLKTEGVTFEHVLDDLRRRLALNYLDAGKTSINEIAYLVGFSDAATFSRAFKRWTGLSPRAARAEKR